MNLKSATRSNKVETEATEDSKTPVWNILQVNRLIDYKWYYHDWLSKDHSQEWNEVHHFSQPIVIKNWRDSIKNIAAWV